VAEKRKDYQAAADFYRKAVEIDPTFEDGYVNLAAALANMKRYPEAIAALKKVLSLSPKDEAAQSMLYQVERLAKQNR
jgi:tetratricopeptide (TPR) repeat protein